MRTLSAFIFILLAIVVIAALSGCLSGTGAANQTDTPPNASISGAGTTVADLKAGLTDLPNYTITITGGNRSPVTVTYGDLLSMDFVEAKNASMMRMSGAGVEKTGDYIGVPLMDIVAKAGLPGGNITYAISAPDGYTMNYTQEQLQNSLLGLKLNGTALTDIVDQNSIVLVEPGERGPMWIMVPNRIDIIRK